MSTQSIQSSLSSFQFLTRKLNQFSRVHTPETPKSNLPQLETNQPLLTTAPEKIAEHHIVNGVQKAIG
jgi:hypothetical protein